MWSRFALLTTLTFALAVGCTPVPPPADDACRQLVAAAPADWPGHWRAVRKLGDAASPALIRALRANPEGPGAQAAVHLLGDLEAESARTYLEEVLVDGTSLSAEAALALGVLAHPESEPPLRRAVNDKATPVPTRAAAAAALISMGKARSALPFVEAVFLAASPNGAASTRAQGLPRGKTRWAHERNMLIEALRRRYDGETFGLDEDASWPKLRKATARMREFIEQAK